MKKNNIYIFLIFLLFSLCAPLVRASEFSFDTLDKNVSVGQEFKIDLNINTENENINAVKGKIIFSTDLLELSEIRDGNSFVNFWIDRPIYQDGGIIFSGITPGGYTLDKGLILSIVFKAKKEGNALIKINNGSVLKNDGNGTESKLKISNLDINILYNDQTKEDQTLNIKDKESPDIFKPEISHDPSLFNNKWFITFVAQDKESGIDRYEIKESRYHIFDFSGWIRAENPYLLVDQSLNSFIFIKAIDKAGNERIVKLSPQNPLSLYTNFENWFIIVLVIFVALIYLFLSSNKIKK